MSDAFCETQLIPAITNPDELIPGHTSEIGSHLDSSGRLHLAFEPGSTEIPRVTVRLNGKDWATLSTILDSTAGSQRVTCTLDLPPISDQAQSELIEVIDPETSSLLGQMVLGRREPKVNAYGLKAIEAYGDGSAPLFGASGISLRGTVLTVYGSHLPPMGNPANLNVRFGPGVEYAFERGLPTPDFGKHYWYWPNSDRSGFVVHINLGACAPASNPFTFQFVDTRNRVDSVLLGTVYVLRDLASMIGFPSNLTQLTRVQTNDNPHEVAFQSYNHYRLIDELLNRYGIASRTGLNLLDWGCGHGRITRYFLENWREANIWGMDIDGENLAWCKQRFSTGIFVHSPLLPPSPLASETFDALFGISVMTHLTAGVQQTCLEELARILKPGGLAMLTFNGSASAAFASFWHGSEWWSHWRETGFDAQQCDPALKGKIESDNYYRITNQSIKHVQKTWVRWFDILAIQERWIGFQDVAVLRRRTGSRFTNTV